MFGEIAHRRFAVSQVLALLVLPLVVLPMVLAVAARAQQPFFNDDAHVADYHKWHFETNNEYDVLPFTSRPSVHQDTETVKFSFGAFANCEVGMDFPLITIFNVKQSGLGSPFGLGDADFSIKYNFHKEKEGSWWPAMTASLNIEPPTGDSSKQLGSGLTDYYLNGILQKTLSPKNVVRFNGGASFVRQFTGKFDLGAEVYGGYTTNFNLGRGELQEQIGGNYEVRKKLTVDFGVVTGQAVGSPHFGFQLGLSKDF
jgi:hypothetical protein